MYICPIIYMKWIVGFVLANQFNLTVGVNQWGLREKAWELKRWKDPTEKHRDVSSWGWNTQTSGTKCSITEKCVR